MPGQCTSESPVPPVERATAKTRVERRSERDRECWLASPRNIHLSALARQARTQRYYRMSTPATDSMRIAVVSDIHANLTALEAVIADLATQTPDLVIGGGDLVGSGARPAEVVDLVASLGWPGVRGNTDEVLWNPTPLNEFAARLPSMKKTWDAVAADVAWTRAALGPDRVTFLKTLPLTFARGAVTVVHAGPADTWRSPQATATDAELADTYGALGSS